MDQTCLHWAVKRSQLPILEMLLTCNCDINARDILGRTPLFLAAKANNFEAVKELLLNKANPMIKDNYGTSPFKKTTHNKIKEFLSKAMLYHIGEPLIPVRRRKCTWARLCLAYYDSKKFLNSYH